MKWSKSLIPTLRQLPSDAVVPSHQLMLRAGLIQQVASGSYSYLPLGLRVLRKVMQIVREEMDKAGAVEVFLPTLQPVEWWEQTGRRTTFGENLFVVKDRHGREQALGPTHEEVMTKLFDAYISSYKQLPLTLYQIQTKFRDEFRPRFGVLRSREFQMKDAYSFDLTPEGLDKSYQAMYDAYGRIFERAGVPYVTVDADSGAIGGSGSCEFMIPSETGEDFILSSDKDNYAANVEKAGIGDRPKETPDPTGQLTEVETPNCKSIDDLCGRWKEFTGGKLKPENTLKTLIYRFEGELDDIELEKVKLLKEKYNFDAGGFVFNWIVVVRGDHEINESKLQSQISAFHGREMNFVSKSHGLHLMDESTAVEIGLPVGYVNPKAFEVMNDSWEKARTYIMIDYDALSSPFLVTGANKIDKHVMHWNWNRDFLDNGHRATIADIRNAVEGDPSPLNDGGTLKMSKGIEVGHVFKLGTKYSQAMNVTVQDENNKPATPIMGCYGIGINRIIAGAIESPGGNDDNGIIWPMAITPYHVVVTPIQYKEQMKQVADDLYQQLSAAGIEVLLDDRDEKPGVKFKDADLIGIPVRIVVGDKGLANNEVELKHRAADKPEMVKLDDIITHVQNLVNNA